VGGSAADVDKLGYGFALAKGFFKEEGLNVTNIDFNSGTRAAQAIVGGTVDATDSAYEHALRLQAQGLTFKCLVTFARYPGVAMVAVKGRNVHTLADLKGKIIGVTAPGSLTQTLAVALLNSVGLKKEDASFVGVGVGPSALAAVQSGGQIDALVNVDPTITALLKSGAATMLVDARIEKGSKQAFGGPYPNGCMLASDDFIKKYPNTTQAIANAIVHSMKYLQTASIDDIVKSVPRSYFQDEKIYREALKTDLEMIRWDGLLSPEIGRTVLNGIALLDDKFKNANIDISKTYTNEFTLRALEKFKNFKP
jgi:NitT/TauT family transport system substrate-binding protein